ncbi:SPFH domain-containing protein [Parabacteroides bouchesdurhonensis]|uniref:SPFH domain-containing protein n=1 Tax=Parabacteroides bouchesdurhonensis TaxID=1936995 RepID=UPI000E4BE4AF|nr:SPFH domain-containing protein [Parabacteroides bouchesdurhonensis]RHJ91151.1 SPFH domain-containing protein [Bacteroides sp. AM07-16]
MKTQEKSFDGIKMSGFMALLILLILAGSAIFLLSLSQSWSVVAGILCGICAIIMLRGFMIIEPNNSRVLTFFGRYVGTVLTNGFYWVNPFFQKSKVTLRILNLDIEPIKVNDKVGNPVMIGAVVVWRIKDTYKASFDISGNIREFVQIQSDAALRQVAGMYAYDTNETTDKVTLRSDESGEVTKRLETELNSRLDIAGIEIVEARINYLAYASEIASVMLRRQQADAIIAARERIVEGAVSMVHLALEKLKKDGVVELDEERKAAMVSNLLVVLCADESAQPVVNTGTLYQ